MDSSHTSTANQNPNTHESHTHKTSSPSDLLSSAKVVADAASSAFRHDTNNLDKGKVADAAADLLCAASHYGKLQGEQGKYVEKAETFLHNYNASHSPSNPSSKNSGDAAHSDGGGGIGGYMKMAEGLLKKH